MNQHPKRRFFTRALRTVAATTVAALALAGCQSGGNPGGTEAAGEPITVGLTYTPNIQFAPFYVAEELGYFDEAGVNVELRHHGESEELFGAIKNGTEQMVYASGDEIAQAVPNGVEMRSVATLYAKYPAVLIVPEDSDIKTAEDLRDKKIGVPGAYGQTYFALLAMLARANMSVENIQLEEIGYTQQAALTTGKVDAVMGFANNDAVQIEASGFPVRTIDAVLPESPVLVGPAVAASDSLIEERGEDITRVLEAVSRALDYIRENPEEAVKLSAEYIPTLTSPEQRDAALATLEASLPLMADGDLQNVPAHWTAMVEFMKTRELLPGQVKAELLYTNDLLPGATPKARN